MLLGGPWVQYRLELLLEVDTGLLCGSLDLRGGSLRFEHGWQGAIGQHRLGQFGVARFLGRRAAFGQVRAVRCSLLENIRLFFASSLHNGFVLLQGQRGVTLVLCRGSVNLLQKCVIFALVLFLDRGQSIAKS